jgi:hypothetical protein
MIKTFLGDKDLKARMNDFRKPGIVDLADLAIHGSATKHHNDFGMISLAANPFSDDDKYLCILVAGIHGPGTAQGLRALSDPVRMFSEHPFGGVFEVTLNPFHAWPKRLEGASFRWQTEPYNAEGILANIGLLRAGMPKERLKAEFRLSDEDLDWSEDFVKKYSKPVGKA